MSGTTAFVIAFVLAINFIAAPVQANWFGKRGDKEDLFNLLLQQPQLDNLLATQKLDAEAVLIAIESVLRLWRQQQSDTLIKSRQG